MQAEMSQAVKLLKWNEKPLTLLGISPHHLKNTWFALNVSYMIIFITLEYADLFDSMHSLTMLVDNLMQTIPFTLVLLKIIILRFNCRKLGKVLEVINEDFREENYDNPTEKRVFLAYYKKAIIFFWSSVPLTGIIAVGYYLAPISEQLESMYRNETVVLNLPIHTRTFYDPSNTRGYALSYLAQIPAALNGLLVQMGADSLVVTLMFHTCGSLSVLVNRIENLSTDSQTCGPEIKRLIGMHVRLISMSKTLAESYSVVLSAQLLGHMILVCILSQILLKNAETGQTTDFVNALMYVLVIVLLIYVYCFIGESLIQESKSVHHAFGKCRWEEMSNQDAKSIIICLTMAQQPLVLTAGKFYTFSLASFTQVIKTSMAYLSVLRTFLWLIKWNPYAINWFLLQISKIPSFQNNRVKTEASSILNKGNHVAYNTLATPKLGIEDVDTQCTHLKRNKQNEFKFTAT